jgi:hypothetical protein
MPEPRVGPMTVTTLRPSLEKRMRASTSLEKSERRSVAKVPSPSTLTMSPLELQPSG